MRSSLMRKPGRWAWNARNSTSYKGLASLTPCTVLPSGAWAQASSAASASSVRGVDDRGCPWRSPRFSARPVRPGVDGDVRLAGAQAHRVALALGAAVPAVVAGAVGARHDGRLVSVAAADRAAGRRYLGFGHRLRSSERA